MTTFFVVALRGEKYSSHYWFALHDPWSQLRISLVDEAAPAPVQCARGQQWPDEM